MICVFWNLHQFAQCKSWNSNPAIFQMVKLTPGEIPAAKKAMFTKHPVMAKWPPSHSKTIYWFKHDLCLKGMKHLGILLARRHSKWSNCIWVWCSCDDLHSLFISKHSRSWKQGSEFSGEMSFHQVILRGPSCQYWSYFEPCQIRTYKPWIIC